MKIKAVLGGSELTNYFRSKRVKHLGGVDTDCAYFYQHGKWNYDSSGDTSNYEIVSLDDYLLTLNEGKKQEGWKLIRPEFTQAAYEILRHSDINYSGGFTFQCSSVLEDKFREAGVLEIWFEPIYKEVKKTLPEISGYKGEVQGDFVVYGCQKVHKNLFNTAYCNLEDLKVKGVVVGEDVIEKIREYLNQNSK